MDNLSVWIEGRFFVKTLLTDEWELQFPIIGAPVTGVGGRLAVTISEAGGLGIIRMGSTATAAWVAKESFLVRRAGTFGVGLMVWALAAHPDLFDAGLETHPFIISLSFGDPGPYVNRCHDAGIKVATQVHTRNEALIAASAGVDLIVVQGTKPVATREPSVPYPSYRTC